MTTTTPEVPATATEPGPGSRRRQRSRTRSSARPWASLAAIVIAILWTIPTIGLLISSFRPEERRQDQRLVDLVHATRASPWRTTTRCCTAATPTSRRTSSTRS